MIISWTVSSSPLNHVSIHPSTKSSAAVSICFSFLFFVTNVVSAAAVIIFGMRLMPLPAWFVGRRNRFYSIGVFWEEEEGEGGEKEKEEEGSVVVVVFVVVVPCIYYCLRSDHYYYLSLSLSQTHTYKQTDRYRISCFTSNHSCLPLTHSFSLSLSHTHTHTNRKTDIGFSCLRSDHYALIVK